MKVDSQDRWRRVQSLCEGLANASPAEQMARLTRLEADEDVRAEAFALLQAIRDEAVEQRRHGWFAPPPASVPDPLPQVVGGVRILELIGSGGSGDVFRGVRTVNGTEQLVAVKRFHANRVGPEHLERFAREQRMLAALTHPDIVGFIDAGLTGAGRPYLVMDLVDGQAITSHCDQRRLRLSDRIHLFLSVCDAVQSAHRHLIVHLDLKPSNILVSSDGHVKLLDFGAAKLADPSTGFTRTEPLTLQYASPERLRGEPVSVSCDVYSLGLILFELASGAWPFRGQDSILSVAERAAGEAQVQALPRVVTDQAAEARATTYRRLRSAVSGDLEAVAAKALAHDTGTRYASVEDLAEDLRRFLAYEPVRAQAPGVGYRARKFVRRHAWEVAAAITLVASLAGAALYSAGQAREARQSAAGARLQNRFLTSLFTLAGSDSASRHDMTVRQLLALAEARIAPSLGSNPAAAADVEVTLANGYLAQNARAEARALLERSIERARLAGDVPRQASARASLAYVAYTENESDEAIRHAWSALGLWRQHASRFAPSQAVSTLLNAGNTLSYVNPTDPTTRDHFEACLAIVRAHPDAVEPDSHAQCLRGLAVVYTNLDSRYDDADALLREAVTLQRADPQRAAALASTLQILGFANRYRGRYADDEAIQREASEIMSRLQGANSVAALWQRAVWATSLAGVGRVDDAYREATQVLSAARRIYPEHGSYLLWTPLIAAASAACLATRNDECEALAAEAIATLGPRPASQDPRIHSARGLLGLALARRGRLDEARPLIEDALAMNASRQRPSPFTDLFVAALRAR